jgi:hypothetical protein
MGPLHASIDSGAWMVMIVLQSRESMGGTAGPEATLDKISEKVFETKQFRTEPMGSRFKVQGSEVITA